MGCRSARRQGFCGRPHAGGHLRQYRRRWPDDLAVALGRLFVPGHPERERLAGGSCFARYTVIEDAFQRKTAYNAFQQWLATSTEAASGIVATLQKFYALQSQVTRFRGVESGYAQAEAFIRHLQSPGHLLP